MKKQQTKTTRGFTIIEVVLVLAIAGLIFMMVFLALPALQRSQRDTQRRNDMSRAIAQLQQYQANNRGSLPTDYADFVTNYMVGDSGDDFTDPGGTAYSFVPKTPTMAGATIEYPTAANGQIYYYIGYTCDGEDVKEVTAGASSSQRRIALVYKLENAGRVCESL